MKHMHRKFLAKGMYIQYNSVEINRIYYYLTSCEQTIEHLIIF